MIYLFLRKITRFVRWGRCVRRVSGGVDVPDIGYINSGEIQDKSFLYSHGNIIIIIILFYFLALKLTND